MAGQVEGEKKKLRFRVKGLMNPGIGAQTYNLSAFTAKSNSLSKMKVATTDALAIKIENSIKPTCHNE